MKIKKAALAQGAVTITSENFDSGIMYLGSNVPTASIRKESIGLEVPKGLKPAFLVVQGDKPGLAVHPIMFDGKDRYKRVTRLGATVYGSIKSINGNSNKHLKVEVLDLEGLKARAKKMGTAVEATRRSDDVRFRVLLLAPPSQTCYAGLTVRKGKIRVLNMEHTHGNNDPSLQFVNVEKADAKLVIRELASIE